MTPPAGLVRESVSPDGKYRYRLEVKLSDAASVCLFLMLNPSTRDERTRTGYHLSRERCKTLARARGCGTLVTCNLFAYRCSRPRELRETDDPVGQPENDRHIRAAVRQADVVVCAWGNTGRRALPNVFCDRVRQAVALLEEEEAGGRLYALAPGFTKKGRQPIHPGWRLLPSASDCRRLVIRSGRLELASST